MIYSHDYSHDDYEVKPSDERLAQCHIVRFGDHKQKPKTLRDWALNQQLSLVWWDVFDFSDFNYWCDELTEFWFENEQDALAMRLKWGA